MKATDVNGPPNLLSYTGVKLTFLDFIKISTEIREIVVKSGSRIPFPLMMN